jgi:cytochrome P450
MENGDLMSILLSDPLYAGDDEKTKDELTILFLAGNETIKISSTNTVCYLTQNPTMKKKFLDEVSPAIEAAKGNIIDKLSVEDVEEFTYVR